MNVDNIYFDLTDYTDKIQDEGIDNKAELAKARKLAQAALRYVEAFDEIEEELNEEDLNNEDEEEEETDKDE